MSEPLTRKQLDASGCDTPFCGHDHSTLYFKGRCHPHANREVFYTKATGIISVRCSKCGLLIAEVAVATGVATPYTTLKQDA